jgi:hypothetical protein
MLHAYLDDSGTHDAAPVCVVAGYFAGESKWRNFEREWKAILDSERVSEFHATRFWGRDSKGQRLDDYAGWTDRRANQFLSKLLTVIVKRRISPIGSAVERAAWNLLPLDERRYLTGGVLVADKFKTSGAPSKTYFLPFMFSLLAAARHCSPDQKDSFFIRP